MPYTLSMSVTVIVALSLHLQIMPLTLLNNIIIKDTFNFNVNVIIIHDSLGMINQTLHFILLYIYI